MGKRRMTEQELLIDCLQRLNQAGAAYMLTGSMASNYWGIPRTTHDLDFVLRLQERRGEIGLPSQPDQEELERLARAPAQPPQPVERLHLARPEAARRVHGQVIDAAVAILIGRQVERMLRVRSRHLL